VVSWNVADAHLVGGQLSASPSVGSVLAVTMYVVEPTIPFGQA
jgi:hypothetical protein